MSEPIPPIDPVLLPTPKPNPNPDPPVVDPTPPGEDP